MKKTLDQIRAEAAAENAACRRLEAAGFSIEGWDRLTGWRVVAFITDPNTNNEQMQLWNFPTWQAAAAALLG